MEINSLGISKKKETQSFQQRTSTNFHQESPMPVGPMTLTNRLPAEVSNAVVGVLKTIRN